MYYGMNQQTGTVISDFEHINQSIHDILLTPIGSRVMRRDYGSRIYELIDQPNNQATRLRVMSAVVMALARWEPRIEITRVDFSHKAEKLVVTIIGKRTDLPKNSNEFEVEVGVR